MIDLTPLDVRKKKGDFRRTVRGYDPELVDDFLDMVAERLEELVKQNVALTERAEHLQEQVGSYRDREKALNEALVTAQQLRSEAQAQADKEAELVRREAERQAERIVDEGHRSVREITREIEGLKVRKRQFVRAFRTLLDRYLAEIELEEMPLDEPSLDLARPGTAPGNDDRKGGAGRPSKSGGQESAGSGEPSWLSSLVPDGDDEDGGG